MAYPGLGFSISINLSSRDFGNINLAADVINRCKDLAIPTTCIELEITEGRWLRSMSKRCRGCARCAMQA